MDENRKKEIREMSGEIEPESILGKLDEKTANQEELEKRYPNLPEDTFKTSDIPAEIIRSKVTDPNEPELKTLEIPKCLSLPVNGRIYVVELSSNAVRSRSGLLLPYHMAVKKDDSSMSVKRYFVVCWDEDEIPESIKKKLKVGIELNPFIPPDAQGFTLPRVIDWVTGNEFKVFHYTELAGICNQAPKEVKDEE